MFPAYVPYINDESWVEMYSPSQLTSGTIRDSVPSQHFILFQKQPPTSKFFGYN